MEKKEKKEIVRMIPMKRTPQKTTGEQPDATSVATSLVEQDTWLSFYPKSPPQPSTDGGDVGDDDDEPFADMDAKIDEAMGDCDDGSDDDDDKDVDGNDDAAVAFYATGGRMDDATGSFTIDGPSDRFRDGDAGVYLEECKPLFAPNISEKTANEYVAFEIAAAERERAVRASPEYGFAALVAGFSLRPVESLVRLLVPKKQSHFRGYNPRGEGIQPPFSVPKKEDGEAYERSRRKTAKVDPDMYTSTVKVGVGHKRDPASNSNTNATGRRKDVNTTRGSNANDTGNSDVVVALAGSSMKRESVSAIPHTVSGGDYRQTGAKNLTGRTFKKITPTKEMESKISEHASFLMDAAMEDSRIHASESTRDWIETPGVLGDMAFEPLLQAAIAQAALDATSVTNGLDGIPSSAFIRGDSSIVTRFAQLCARHIQANAGVSMQRYGTGKNMRFLFSKITELQNWFKRNAYYDTFTRTVKDRNTRSAFGDITVPASIHSQYTRDDLVRAYGGGSV
jgi:hypothetical protein